MILQFVSILFLARQGQTANCDDFLPPLSSSTGNDIGIIMIPGAQISGVLYEPLMKEVQKQMPGAKIWAGLTSGWLGNFPNPLEISAAVDDCLRKANEQGLGGPVYMAGHSLGGIMLETWIANNPTKTDGILLLGSYLPDLFGDHNNIFPVPVATIVGELDGLTLSYVYREWLESSAAENEQSSPGRYPVQVINDVNHGQVASGEIPDFVTSSDIPSPITFEEAHSRYANSIGAFITLQSSELFTQEDVEAAKDINNSLTSFTNDFLVPFSLTSIMESDQADVPSSWWVIEGQKIILGAEDGELDMLEVVDFVVPSDDLGGVKPQINSGEPCQAVVITYSEPQYDSSIADANILYSASVLKAKFKLGDVVREALCLPEASRKQCKDINIQAFSTAMSVASDEAKERFELLGTRLVFDDDIETGWGPGWLYSGGLHYSKINSTHTRLYSTYLISEPDFIDASKAGMHYCDLLSPFRALEWIYITGLQGKSL